MAGHRVVGGTPAAIEWPEWEDDLPGNVLGCAHAFTAFAPMPWWAVPVLRFKLAWVKLLPTTALRKHHFVYFGRWTLPPRLPGTGRKGDRYVLIETNFNGTFAEYLDTLAGVLSENLDQIWGRCYGCPPGMQPPSEFRRWGRMHELAAAHYFCAYPDATVKQIEMALVRQSGGSAAEAQRAIREMPHLTVLQRMRGALGRLLRPSEVAPVGAHPGVRRDKSAVCAVSALTPVKPDKLEALRYHLAGLDGDTFDVAGTHVARLVVVDQLVNEKVSDAPVPVDPPMLLFGAVGDGKPEEYLDRLCVALSGDALRIWTKHCDDVDDASLRDHLWRHRLRGGLLYGGYKASIADVKAALAEEPTGAGCVDPQPAAGLGTSVEAVREEDHVDIQGNLLTPYALPYGAYLLVNITRAERGRAWLEELVERQRVTSAGDQDPKLSAAWNVAFTYEGLQALGVPERFLRLFPQDFRDGMETRAKRLGDDVGDNQPGGWEPGLRQRDGGHAMLMLRANTDPARDALVEQARELVGRHELAVVYDDASSLVPKSPKDLQKCGGGAREHFGFADGCSQPAIEGTRAADKDEYQRVRAGEFLLGYRDVDGLVTGEMRFFRNGSFMVFRKLEQRAGVFKRVLESCELPADLVAAKIVGRWRNGEPLVMDKHERGSDRRPDLNDFRYGSPVADGPADHRPEDPWGRRCPLGAHIRRAFPRDALVGGETRSRRHRILRRGMPYGEKVPDDVPDDEPDEGRGLLFVCFNASIARQFETVQSWCLDGNLFDVPGEADFLLAPSEATMTIQHDGRTYRLKRKDPLVVTRGGGYFFYPGIGALRAIATGNYAGQEDPLPA